MWLKTSLQANFNPNSLEVFYDEKVNFSSVRNIVEDDDGNVSFTAFAIFTIRQIQNNETSDQSYILSGTLESDGSGRLVITELNTLTKIYFQAD